MSTMVPGWKAMRERAGQLLLEGISPQRLALTLALGFVVGCIPVVGIPTALCGLMALVFRLNLPAIQAANYAAMPFQLALLLPFVRLGGKLTPGVAHPVLNLTLLAHSPLQLVTHSSAQLLAQLEIMAGQALLAWLLLAIPMVVVLTAMLTEVLRRVPALSEQQN